MGFEMEDQFGEAGQCAEPPVMLYDGQGGVNRRILEKRRSVRRERSPGRGFGQEQAERDDSSVEQRLAALETQHRAQLARAGMSAELSRMQSAIFPSKHPGIYSTVDQFVSMYEMPPSHRGPMCVAGAAAGVLKEPHIKLAFLGEGLWQYTRRKCAEAGENLTERQIQEIEAQVIEFYGRQKAEGAKILDKAETIPGRGNR